MLFVDMDGTIVEWKPAKYFEELFQKGRFRNLDPYKAVVDAVKIIAQKEEVYILSAFLPLSKYAVQEKHEWLDDDASFIPYSHRILVPQGIQKAEYVKEKFGAEKIGKDMFLLDDYSVNLHDWQASGGSGIKLLNGINGTNGTWAGPAVSRFRDASEIARQILKIMKEEM